MPRSRKSGGSDLPKALAPQELQRIALFRYQLRKFLRFSEKLCRANGLTPLQYQLLIQIVGAADNEPQTIGMLAERLQAQHHGVVALVDRCERLGLVARRQAPEDRRSVEVHLTPTGRTVASQLAALHQPELRLLNDFLTGAARHD